MYKRQYIYVKNKSMHLISELQPGRWFGSYKQNRKAYGFEASLVVQPDGAFSGTGQDDDIFHWNKDGFVIDGRYDSSDLTIVFTKSYTNSHDVLYRGILDPNNGIYGTWTLGCASGTFTLKSKASI